MQQQKIIKYKFAMVIYCGTYKKTDKIYMQYLVQQC
jgi:hypothetical protein